MGKKKSTTEQTNKPVYSAEIMGAAKSQQDAYNSAQPAINQYATNMSGASNDLLAQYRQGDPTIQAAQGVLQEQMRGGPNPYVDQMVDITNDNVRNQMQARMATRGQTGGSAYNDLITRALAQNETGLRYQDYDRNEARRTQAAGMAPGLLAGSYLPLDMAMRAGESGAMLPLQASLANSAGVGGLLGQYQNVKGKTTQSGGLLESILGAGAQLGSAAIMACDARLKENAVHVGHTPGGVPVYQFDYIDGPKGIVGPMAQEVAELQPNALGPWIDGYMTVDMGALR